MEEKKNALEGVKVGDELVYCPWNNLNRIVTVTKVTKTQVDCGNYGKYRISDGYAVGGDRWCRSAVRFPNDADEIQKVKDTLLKVKYVGAIKNGVACLNSGEDIKKIDLETLKNIYVLVKKVVETIETKK